jgi:hypothetical protein
MLARTRRWRGRRRCYRLHRGHRPAWREIRAGQCYAWQIHRAAPAWSWRGRAKSIRALPYGRSSGTAYAPRAAKRGDVKAGCTMTCSRFVCRSQGWALRAALFAGQRYVVDYVIFWMCADHSWCIVYLRNSKHTPTQGGTPNVQAHHPLRPLHPVHARHRRLWLN